MAKGIATCYTDIHIKHGIYYGVINRKLGDEFMAHMDIRKNIFFDDSEPMLTVDKFYGRTKKVCDVGIITFSEKVMEWMLREYECEKAAEVVSANGNRPIYTTLVNGRIGSACAGSMLEDFAYLTGTSKFVMFGSCGTLNAKETDGKIIVPTDAYRDEGLSWHYLASEDEYIDMTGSRRVADFMRKRVPYITGKTWTTDAIFRETVGKAERLRNDGCIAVEMECAGVQAVCACKGFELYDFLFASDYLGETEWTNKMLGTETESDMQVRCMKLALELASEI